MTVPSTGRHCHWQRRAQQAGPETHGIAPPLAAPAAAGDVVAGRPTPEALTRSTRACAGVRRTRGAGPLPLPLGCHTGMEPSSSLAPTSLRNALVLAAPPTALPCPLRKAKLWLAKVDCSTLWDRTAMDGRRVLPGAAGGAAWEGRAPGTPCHPLEGGDNDTRRRGFRVVTPNPGSDRGGGGGSGGGGGGGVANATKPAPPSGFGDRAGVPVEGGLLTASGSRDGALVT